MPKAGDPRISHNPSAVRPAPWNWRGALLPALCVLGVLAVVWLRAASLPFGLPSVLDPDESLFVLISFDMVDRGSANPGWFGHPGTTLIYALTLLHGLVFWVGRLFGEFADLPAFGRAIYTNPTLAFLPGRVLVYLTGLVGVAITFLVGRKLGHSRIGMMAAAILLCSPLHAELARLIRTDIPASLFMMLATLASLKGMSRNDVRWLYLSAFLAGVATATKWPAGAVVATPILAIWLGNTRSLKRRLSTTALLAATWLGGLLFSSPFLLGDIGSLLGSLGKEFSQDHITAVKGGPLANMLFYLSHAIPAALGWVGLLLGLVGLINGRRKVAILVAILMPLAILMAMLVLHPLAWERWVLLPLPYLALLAAFGFDAVADVLRHRVGGQVGAFAPTVIAVGLLLPLLTLSVQDTRMRMNDTRSRAEDWILANSEPSDRIATEWLAFRLLRPGHEILYPMGPGGCMSSRTALSGQIRFNEVEAGRQGMMVVTLGSVDAASHQNCGADYYLVSQYERYRENPAIFADILGNYARLFAAGEIVATFRPEPWRSSGPVVHVVRRSPTTT